MYSRKLMSSVLKNFALCFFSSGGGSDRSTGTVFTATSIGSLCDGIR